jgi:hypothetical protein
MVGSSSVLPSVSSPSSDVSDTLPERPIASAVTVTVLAINSALYAVALIINWAV